MNTQENLKEVALDKKAILIVIGIHYRDALVVDALLDLVQENPVTAVIIESINEI